MEDLPQKSQYLAIERGKFFFPPGVLWGKHSFNVWKPGNGPAGVLTCPAPGRFASSFSSSPHVSITSSLLWIRVHRAHWSCIQCAILTPTSHRIMKHQRFRCEIPVSSFRSCLEVMLKLEILKVVPNSAMCHSYWYKEQQAGSAREFQIFPRVQEFGQISNWVSPRSCWLSPRSHKILRRSHEIWISWDLGWDHMRYAPKILQDQAKKRGFFSFCSTVLWGKPRQP